jgi:general secretion pathway protein K
VQPRELEGSCPAPGARATAPATGQRGFVLLAVLWLTMVMALLAVHVIATARTESRLAHNAIEQARAEALADAGVHRAILGLLAPPPARPWRVDGTAYVFPFGGGQVRVAIQDEAGKLDLNLASEELLRGLFMAMGLSAQEAADMTDAILASRAADRLPQAEGALFTVVDELSQVLGMTPELYRQVAPFFTVHSWAPGIDPATAPREVLRALPGITPERVEALLAARSATAAGSRQPLVDQRHQRARRVGDRPAKLVKALEPPLAGLDAFLSPSSGRIFAINAEAHSAGGGAFVRKAIVRLPHGPDQFYHVHSWRRGDSGSAPE